MSCIIYASIILENMSKIDKLDGKIIICEKLSGCDSSKFVQLIIPWVCFCIQSLVGITNGWEMECQQFYEREKRYKT